MLEAYYGNEGYEHNLESQNISCAKPVKDIPILKSSLSSEEIVRQIMRNLTNGPSHHSTSYI